jgi:hypothetical protein
MRTPIFSIDSPFFHTATSQSIERAVNQQGHMPQMKGRLIVLKSLLEEGMQHSDEFIVCLLLRATCSTIRHVVNQCGIKRCGVGHKLVEND